MLPRSRLGGSVFPTPVGVFLVGTWPEISRKSLPHARGGVSGIRWRVQDAKASSPRPWGCFQDMALQLARSAVFPTPVGVFLCQLLLRCYSLSLPHARGGVSLSLLFDNRIEGSSPRPWGCFFLAAGLVAGGLVFPTPVGVFPGSVSALCRYAGLPHARGGVSLSPRERLQLRRSSPRPWGCFSAFRPYASSTRVFPTPVGVFPIYR